MKWFGNLFKKTQARATKNDNTTPPRKKLSTI